MKKATQLNLLLISFLFSFGNIIAQNHNHDHSHGNHQHNTPIDFVSDEDIQAITGFDETAAIKEIKAIGIKGDSEIEGALRSKKIEHILVQRGISLSSSPYFSEKIRAAGPCDNAGFEQGNFTNWVGATGKTNVGTWIPGFISSGNNAATTNTNAQHTLLSNATGFDPNARNSTTGAFELPLIAPGGSPFSVRLGNQVTGYGMEKMSYQIAVTPQNTSFTYQYAVVMQSPAGHTTLTQPRFEIKVYDQTGTLVTGPCGVYSVEGLAAATDTTFRPYYSGSTGIGTGTPTGFYKKWTTVTIDLSPYINTTCTIEFSNRDCDLGGHYGYSYIDAGCSKLQATVSFCPNDTLLLLNAPPGFNAYQWYDNNNVPIPGPNGTNDTLTVINPVLGQTYTVAMLSASGCGSTLALTLNYTNLNTTLGSTNVKCFGDNDGFAYVSASGPLPPFTYSWVDSTSGQQISVNDSLLNAIAGTYYVTSTSKGGCSKTDTIVITQPANAGDTLAVDLVFCPGDNEIVLSAPTGPNFTSYTWYAGNNANGPVLGNDTTLTIFNPVPGTQYYVQIGTPPPGCDLFLTTVLNYKPPGVMPDYTPKVNVFSPNGDGYNDFFDLSNFPHVQDFKVEIYDRWGKKVFTSYDMSVHWDGKKKGKVVDDGVYFWMATYKQACYEDAPEIKTTGFVHVMR